MPNFLHPDAVTDILEALLRTAPGLSADTRRRLHRVLTRYVHEAEHESVLVRTLPSSTPAWAEGKALVHFLPSRELQADVRRVAFLISQAEAELEEGKLAISDPVLTRTLTSLIKGIPHRTWRELVTSCRLLIDELLLWRKAQERSWTRQIVWLGKRRRWRRLRSGQELWDAAAGASWCVRKGEVASEGYVEALCDKSIAMWVLEEGGDALALLSYDPTEDEILEVRDRWNQLPIRYRRAVRTLATHLGATQPRLPEVRALVLDARPGHISRSWWSGELRSRFGGLPLQFRLWSDGRKRSYYVEVREVPNDPWHYLYLRATGRGWMLEGLTPDGWNGSLEALMRQALRKVGSTDGRAHWRSAMKGLRGAAVGVTG